MLLVTPRAGRVAETGSAWLASVCGIAAVFALPMQRAGHKSRQALSRHG
jgi:hypothetical protein